MLNNKVKFLLIVCGVGVALTGGYIAFSGKTTEAYWDGKTALNSVAADGELPLIKAVAAKDKVAVALLLKKGALFTKKNKKGESALSTAVKLGATEILPLFAKADAKDFADAEVMKAAIESENDAMVGYVLTKGGDANAVVDFKGRHRPDEQLVYNDPRVTTALKYAVEQNRAAAVKTLLQNGAEGAQYFFEQNFLNLTPATLAAFEEKLPDLNVIAVKGYDLLTYAVAEGTPETIAYLAEHNVGDVNRALKRLLAVRKRDNRYEEALNMLIENGATPDAESLELMMSRKENKLFEKMAECLRKPDVYLPSQKSSLLIYALRKGDVQTADYLLNHGADIWEKDANGHIPMVVMTEEVKKFPKLAEVFESRLKEVDDEGYDGETLLMLYARQGDWTNFKRLVDKGADVWQKDAHEKTVLMYAAEGGEPKIAHFLMTKGDNAETKDEAGKTALMYAAEQGQTAMVKELAELGANLSAVDNEGVNALMYAAKGGHEETADFFINKGESAVYKDNKKRSVLMFAALGGKMNMVQSLLNKGVQVYDEDEDYVSTVSYAVMGGNVEVVKTFINRGGDSVAIDKRGYQPLAYAVEKGNMPMIRLLDRGDNNIRQTKDTGMTLAMLAAKSGNPEAILWAKDGISYRDSLINAKNRYGQTFLMLVGGEARPEVFRELISILRMNLTARDNNGKSVAMYVAEGRMGVNLIALMKKGIGDANVKDKEGRTVLMYAVSGENTLAVKVHTLLNYGADANAADKNAKTVLMYMLGNRGNRVDIAMVKDILAKVTQVDARDNDGRTALMYAAENPNVDVNAVAQLIAKGADVNAKDNNGKTVLMYAASGGDMTKFRLLLRKGADLSARDHTSKTAVDYAAEGDYTCFATAVKNLGK